jgi:thiol-disulfide isomerase/thioredoxin
MKSRTVVFALAVLCAPLWAQSADDDAAKAEAWFNHAIELHPDLADDHDALVQRMGAGAADYRSMALIEEMRGNSAKSTEYLRIATQVAPNDPDAAFYYAMSLREVDPVEYRKLAEAVAIRFPESDRGVQAIYWLALDTPLLDDRIALLEHYYQAPLPRAILPSLPSVKELLFEAYTFQDLDKARSVAPVNDLFPYAWGLVLARDALRQGTRKGALDAVRLIEDMEATGLPARINHTPFYLMMAAAHGGLDGYGSLLKAMAKEPSDALRDALEHSGAKIGKTPGQIQADVRTTVLAQAKPAPPLALTSFDGSKVSLADYHGKAVLVNFWRPSCAACRAESPFLQQVLRKIGPGKMSILEVNVRPAEDRYALSYIHGNGYYFTPLHADGPPHDAPSSLLIDAEGRVIAERGAIRGAADARELELQIEAALSHPNAGALTAGDRVPDFAFTDLAGKNHDFHEYHGAITLVEFCGPCGAELPDLKELYSRYRDRGFDILGMEVETSDHDGAHTPWVSVVHSTAARLATELFGVKTLPAKVLIDTEGFVIGPVEKPQDLDLLLASRLAEKR